MVHLTESPTALYGVIYHVMYFITFEELLQKYIDGETPPTEFILKSVRVISITGFDAAKHGMASDKHKATVNKRARIFFFTMIPP